jgi:hypothetical protein
VVVVTAPVVAVDAAEELLRTALLCKLAVDLQDPVLARRAARAAAGPARLLSGLDFASYVELDDGWDGGGGLPEVQDLLEALHPGLSAAESEPSCGDGGEDAGGSASRCGAAGVAGEAVAAGDAGPAGAVEDVGRSVAAEGGVLAVGDGVADSGGDQVLLRAAQAGGLGLACVVGADPERGVGHGETLAPGGGVW